MTVKIVQCGWCPVILADDLPVILLHFAEDHCIYNGSHSVRYIQGADWDVAELAPARTFTPGEG
jgi:hypothetical protein